MSGPPAEVRSGDAFLHVLQHAERALPGSEALFGLKTAKHVWVKTKSPGHEPQGRLLLIPFSDRATHLGVANLLCFTVLGKFALPVFFGSAHSQFSGLQKAEPVFCKAIPRVKFDKDSSFIKKKNKKKPCPCWSLGWGKNNFATWL